jgi:hypothetical protein
MIDFVNIREACYALGMSEPISIEPDGTVWIGEDDNRSYPNMKQILKKAEEIAANRSRARTSAISKLVELGLNESEIGAIFGI